MAFSPSAAPSPSSSSSPLLELDLHSPLRPSSTSTIPPAAAAQTPYSTTTVAGWAGERAHVRTRTFDFRTPPGPPALSASPSPGLEAGGRKQPGSPSPAAQVEGAGEFRRQLEQTFAFDTPGDASPIRTVSTGLQSAGSLVGRSSTERALAQSSSPLTAKPSGSRSARERKPTRARTRSATATAMLGSSSDEEGGEGGGLGGWKWVVVHDGDVRSKRLRQETADATRDVGGLLSLSLSLFPVRQSATATALRIPELLSLILAHLPSSPQTLAAALRVSRMWFSAAAPVLWESVAFEVCGRLFEMAHLIEGAGKWGRKERQYTRDVFPLPEGAADRHNVYASAVRDCHITEVVKQGESVDVMILRRKYPAMAPFINLQRVYLHRLSPQARYMEAFCYQVKHPEMWLDLTSTSCAHRLDVLSASTKSPDTRHLFISSRDRALAAGAAEALDSEPHDLVWIQTSVFLHYQFLRRFALEMPASWQLDRRHALDMLRAIATSPNRAHLEELKCSPSLPVLDPVRAPPTVDERGIALAPARLVIPAGSALLLFTLHALTTVELECAFTDVHISFLAKSWPNLRSLVLRSPPLVYLDRAEAQTTGAHFVPQPTIRALTVLATRCLQLEHLKMDLQPPPPAALVSVQTAVTFCPIFGPRLARLSITGWTAIDIDRKHVSFLAIFVARAVPPTCVLDLPTVALGGLVDLFAPPTRRHETQWLTATLKQLAKHPSIRHLAWPGTQPSRPAA